MNLLRESFGVAIGGGVGCLARFFLSRWVQRVSNRADYPWGIFGCNVLGCLLIGILAGIFLYRFEVGPFWRAALLIGLLGGFTTFASFSIDTIVLFQQGDTVAAISNIVLTLVFCFLATLGGLVMTKALIA